MQRKLPSAFLFFTASLLFFVSCAPSATATSTSSPIPLTDTPPAELTAVAGDLGWGTIHGKIIDGNTGLPIAGARVKCEHVSYTSPSRCRGTVTTDAEGLYVFEPIFFHDTDQIMLLVEAPGYAPAHFEQSFFTFPDLRADLSLFPPAGATSTPTPFLMCTAPACPGGDLVCGKPEGCPGGCGTICLTATPQ